jgi:hypothetical protein
MLLVAGTIGLSNPNTKADQSSVTVKVEVKHNTPSYEIVDPLGYDSLKDSRGPMVIKTQTYPVVVEHVNVSRLEYYDCFGAQVIASCPSGVTPFATVDYTNPTDMTGSTVRNVDFGNNVGEHRIFVKAYQAGVLVDLGQAVDVLYDPNASPQFKVKEVNDTPYHGTKDPIEVISEDVDITIVYVDVREVEVWDDGKKVGTCTTNQVNGLLPCPFKIVEGLNPEHTITVKAIDNNGNYLQDEVLIIKFGDDLGIPDTGGSTNEPNTGLFKIGDLTIGKEDVFVSVSVLVIALVSFGLYIACRRKDQKQQR